MKELIQMYPLKSIVAECIYPYDFYQVYRQIFRTGKAFAIPSSLEEVINDLGSLCHEEDEFGSYVYLDGHTFTHETGSGRLLIYDVDKLSLTIDLRNGSSTFGYQILAALAPLMQPEKWRGFGGGNMDVNGQASRPFKLYITY